MLSLGLTTERDCAGLCGHSKFVHPTEAEW
jgi:hypothetical protein